jgi:hypothetical protein
MEEPTNDQKSQSVKIMPTVRDPAIQGKKALGFSPNIHEPNYKNKKYKQKNPFLKKSQGHYGNFKSRKKGGYYMGQ